MRVAHTALTSIALTLLILAADVQATPTGAVPEGPPWLGVVISDGIHGVRLREIIPDTPADEAGMQLGDEIIEVDGARVVTVPVLQSAIAARKVFDQVAITVWRNGAPVTLQTVLAPKLSASEILYRRLVGNRAPGFDLPSISRTRINAMEHLRGQVVVLQFFATNCRECEPIHRQLSRLVDERGRDGLTVLAMSREPRSMIEPWVRTMEPSFGVLHDRYGQMADAYRVDRVPAIVVINRDGDICYAGIGSEENLDHALFAARRALRQGASYWSR